MKIWGTKHYHEYIINGEIVKVSLQGHEQHDCISRHSFWIQYYAVCSGHDGKTRKRNKGKEMIVLLSLINNMMVFSDSEKSTHLWKCMQGF
jgi:hypothetical protein